MSDVYRGVALMPSPYGSRNSWVINDGGYGYVTGGSKADVIARWRRLVDESITRDVLSSGHYEYQGSDLYGCKRCGLIAFDVSTHEEWHNSDD